MRRFYTNVTITAVDNGHSIHLDGKPVKTPMKTLLTVRTATLAEAIADEWRAQEVFIVPHSMPLTQLASTAIDRVAPNLANVIDDLLEYAKTDLVCYRATEPDELVASQSALFDPLLEWFEEQTGAALVVARGVMPVEQPDETIAAVAAWLQTKSAEAVTAIQVGAALASSLVIALALSDGELGGDRAFEAANCDELYQIRKWGEDEDARERLDAVRLEFAALERFVGLTTL